MTRCTCTALVAVFAAAGCTRDAPNAAPVTFQQEEAGYVMVIVLDLSGSYASHMDGKAWTAVNSLIRNFYRERMGETDFLVIGQISGTPEAPIWEGNPKDFGRSVGGPSGFRNLLTRSSNAGGSRVYDSISDSIDWALPKIGKGRAGLFVFSDMDDNLSAPGAEERLVRSLGDFLRKGGAVGFYWVDVSHVPKWRGHLKSGGRNAVVESSIAANPEMPKFD